MSRPYPNLAVAPLYGCDQAILKAALVRVAPRELHLHLAAGEEPQRAGGVVVVRVPDHLAPRDLAHRHAVGVPEPLALQLAQRCEARPLPLCGSGHPRAALAGCQLRGRHGQRLGVEFGTIAAAHAPHVGSGVDGWRG
eukprot:CAMPEP_0179239632 /NCGR_PEP_ID=MMETSP0797-20121207/15561_1 /TAXON_ID=47934 /ORGANISM="Dinophysis acuminata, Strain DAEP01" /LENGTH=137 /DNA_ID=CAMNT_0020946961 /DNA_START=52 /DNA_END=461 /DNA_ORIENTATION=-